MKFFEKYSAHETTDPTCEEEVEWFINMCAIQKFVQKYSRDSRAKGVCIDRVTNQSFASFFHDLLFDAYFEAK